MSDKTQIKKYIFKVNNPKMKEVMEILETLIEYGQAGKFKNYSVGKVIERQFQVLVEMMIAGEIKGCEAVDSDISDEELSKLNQDGYTVLENGLEA